VPYIGSEAAALFRANLQRRSVFWRLGTEPPLNVWCGIGDFEGEMSPVSVGSETYLGSGIFGQLDELQQLANGEFERCDFTLSGLNQAVANLIATDDTEVRGAPVHVGLLAFDSDWQPATPIIPVAVLTAEQVSLQQDKPSNIRQPRTYSVIITCVYGHATRSRSKITNWSPPHQKRRDGVDTSCDWVFRYQSGYDVAWPDF